MGDAGGARAARERDIELFDFPRVDAYVALYPYLTKLVVPAGVGNMAANRPPADVNLLAVKASLIVRRDVDPGLQYLLLDAATQIHSEPEIFQKAGQFPAPEPGGLPVSADAQEFFRSGRPFLQRYLPFWLAGIAGKLLVVLVPLVGVVYPLLRLAPALYGWMMRSRVFRLYGELKLIEADLEAHHGDAAALLRRLDHLEERADHLQVPLAFAQTLYHVRSHIDLIRGRLQQAGRGCDSRLSDRRKAGVHERAAARIGGSCRANDCSNRNGCWRIESLAVKRYFHAGRRIRPLLHGARSLRRLQVNVRHPVVTGATNRSRTDHTDR